jgi:hypothetical protein
VSAPPHTARPGRRPALRRRLSGERTRTNASVSQVVSARHGRRGRPPARCRTPRRGPRPGPGPRTRRGRAPPHPAPTRGSDSITSRALAGQPENTRIHASCTTSSPRDLAYGGRLRRTVDRQSVVRPEQAPQQVGSPDGGRRAPGRPLVLHVRLPVCPPSERRPDLSLQEGHGDPRRRSRVYARKATNVWPGSSTGAIRRPERDSPPDYQPLSQKHANHCCRPRRHELWSISSP